MRAVVVETPGSVSVTEVADPTPGPGEVVVAPRACGICGTDLHILDGDLSLATYPIIPGHEFAGEVVAAGSGVTSVRVGQRVAVDPARHCGRCDQCRDGYGNRCENYAAIGVTEPGACAEYIVVEARHAYVLPDAMSWTAAALIEPLACAVRGMDRLGDRLGAHFLVYGAGTMGLLLAQLALRAGASTVDLVDTKESRLDLARRLGATGAATGAGALGRPAGWEVVVDATGVIAAVEDGLTRVRRGGTFLQFGVSPSEATARFSPFRVYHEEIDIIGSMAVLNTYRRAVELMADGFVDAEAMVSDRVPLADYADAIDLFRSGTGRKIHITP